MRFRPSSLAVFAAVLLGVAPASVGQGVAGSAPLTREAQEVFLRTAAIVSMRTSSVGTTAPKIVTLSDGAFTHDAQIQDVDEHEFQRIHNTLIDPDLELVTPLGFSNSYKYNVAAYVLDTHLEIGMVPVTVDRVIDGRTCAVTWWVDDFMMDESARADRQAPPPDTGAWAGQMDTIRIFDQLIDNIERADDDLLITNDWKIWMIDHTRTFGTAGLVRAPETLERSSRSLLDKLRHLDEGSLRGLLGAYLTTDEIGGLAARAKSIVRWFDQRIEEHGAGAVLYDWPPP